MRYSNRLDSGFSILKTLKTMRKTDIVARKRKVNVKALIQKIPNSVKLAIIIVLVAKLLVLSIGYITAYLNNGGAPLAVVMDMFNRWDAPHYVDIAKNWYVSNPTLDA